MTKSNLKSQILTLLAVVALLFTACNKDEPLLEDNQTTTQNFVDKATENGKDHDVDETDLDILCFDFVYPITITFPEGTSETVNDEDMLWKAIDDWYENNPDSDEDPGLQFPVTIKLEDGSTLPIANDDELIEVLEVCYEEWEDEEEWEDFEEDEWDEECPDHDDEDCFDVFFPVQFKIGDQIYTVNDWDEADSIVYHIIDSTDMDDDFDVELIFPITVILQDGSGSTVVLESEEDLEKLEDECYGDYDDDEECFEIDYPITLNIPDGTTVVVNNDEEMYAAIEKWEDDNPDSNEEVYPVFPITVVLLDGSGTTVVLQSEEDLERLEDECYDEYEDDELCFEIDYPITLNIPDGTTVVVNNDDEFEEAVEKWYDDNPDSDEEIYPIFPITVTLDDNTQLVINNAQELEALWDSCD